MGVLILDWLVRYFYYTAQYKYSNPLRDRETFIVFRHVLSFASVLGLALTLTACGNGEPPQQLPRPVMVVHPQPASEARESYPGEVHARYEPELAFRIGGKVV